MKSKEEFRDEFQEFSHVLSSNTDFEPVMQRNVSRWDVIPNGRRIKRKNKK